MALRSRPLAFKAPTWSTASRGTKCGRHFRYNCCCSFWPAVGNIFKARSRRLLSYNRSNIKRYGNRCAYFASLNLLFLEGFDGFHYIVNESRAKFSCGQQISNSKNVNMIVFENVVWECAHSVFPMAQGKFRLCSYAFYVHNACLGVLLLKGLV